MNWALTLVGSFVGSIILAVVGNLLTDVFKDFLARRSLHSQQNRLKALRREMEQITALHADQHKALLDAAISILVVQLTFMTGLAAGIVATSIYLLLRDLPLNPGMYALYYSVAIIAVIGGASLIYIGIAFGIKGVDRLYKVVNFEHYKENTEKKIGETVN